MRKHILMIAIALLGAGVLNIYAQTKKSSSTAKSTSTAAASSLPQVKNFNASIVPFKMNLVKAGTYHLEVAEEYDPDYRGPEKMDHDFYLGDSEVTQQLWEYVMCQKPAVNQGNNNPVENITWEDCQKFILSLNQLTGQYFRLPTHKEWECSFCRNMNIGQRVSEWLQDCPQGNYINRYYATGNVNHEGECIMSEYNRDGYSEDVFVLTRSPHLGMRLAMTPNPKIIIPNGVYMIYPVDDPNYQLEIQDINKVEGANIKCQVRLAFDHMLWRVINHGNGTISIHPLNASHLTIEVADGVCENNRNVRLWSYLGYENQKWYPEKTGSNAYVLHVNRDRAYNMNLEGKGACNVNIHKNPQSWVFQRL